MYSAVILCAGKGSRTKLEYNKMFYKINNETLYEKVTQIFIKDNQCHQIIIVAKKDEIPKFQELLHHPKIEFVEGGKERQDSVYAGLKKVNKDYVLIHDGARPYLKQQSINDLLECLKKHTACLLMVPSKDTVKEVVDGKVIQTLPREKLMQAQTPQAFKTEVILNAYEKGIEANLPVTDDASMVEQFSDEDVFVVMGDYENIKVTTTEDLV